MRRSVLIVTSILIAAASSAALAQPQAPANRRIPSFAEQDTNKDDKVSKQEYASSLPSGVDPGLTDRIFARLDTNNDGFITKGEVEASVAQAKGK